MMSQNLTRAIINLQNPKGSQASEGWEPFFLPKDFVKMNFALRTEDFSIQKKELYEKGKEVSQLRKQFLERAE